MGLNDPEEAVRALAQRRKGALKLWEKHDYPLTWNLSNSTRRGCYHHLLEILNDNPNKDCLPSLQHSSDRLTYNQLASSLVAFATSDRQQVMAPIASNGYFAHALPLAVKQMERFKPVNTTLVEFARDIFASMFRKLEIHFLPWHRDAAAHGGRPRAVQADWWMVIDRADCSGSSVPADHRVTQTSTMVALSVAAEDPSAPWRISGKLRDMGSLWKKTTRPEDWSLKRASLGNVDYISETYHYVDRKYTGTNWTHHMAMIWAILFSRVVPYVTHDNTLGYKNSSSAKEATRIVRDMPWKKAEENRRGVKDRGPYIVMMSTAIMALRDPQSPLSVRARKNKDALGKPWTDKHGMRIGHSYV